MDAVRTEQRIALNSLKAHGRKKNVVYNVRVAENSRRPPGILLPLAAGHNSNPNPDEIRVYNVSASLLHR